MAKPGGFVSALSIACAVLIASPSWAAIVEPGYGDLTINQGHGFKPVTDRTQANVGDSVMVGPGGAAAVVYEDGCKVDVQPGSVARVAPLSPCASGSNAQERPGECRDQYGHIIDCGATAGTWAFWAVWLGGLGFIIAEIVDSAHGQPAPQPASP